MHFDRGAKAADGALAMILAPRVGAQGFNARDGQAPQETASQGRLAIPLLSTDDPVVVMRDFRRGYVGVVLGRAPKHTIIPAELF